MAFAHDVDLEQNRGAALHSTEYSITFSLCLQSLRLSMLKI